MTIWDILGIEPTEDTRLIRHRYAELVKLYHPEEQPEAYQQILSAYQAAMDEARRNKRGVKEDSISLQEEEEAPSLFSIDRPHTKSESTLDFGQYQEVEFLIQTALSEILGNADWSLEQRVVALTDLFERFYDSADRFCRYLESQDVYIFSNHVLAHHVLQLVTYYMGEEVSSIYVQKLSFWSEILVDADRAHLSFEDLVAGAEAEFQTFLATEGLLQDPKASNQSSNWVELLQGPFSASHILNQVFINREKFSNPRVLEYLLYRLKGWLRNEKEGKFQVQVSQLLEILWVTCSPNIFWDSC